MFSMLGHGVKETMVDQGVLNAGISGHSSIPVLSCLHLSYMYLIYLKHYFAETVSYSGHC